MGCAACGSRSTDVPSAPPAVPAPTAAPAPPAPVEDVPIERALRPPAAPRRADFHWDRCRAREPIELGSIDSPYVRPELGAGSRTALFALGRQVTPLDLDGHRTGPSLAAPGLVRALAAVGDGFVGVLGEDYVPSAPVSLVRFDAAGVSGPVLGSVFAEGMRFVALPTSDDDSAVLFAQLAPGERGQLVRVVVDGSGLRVTDTVDVVLTPPTFFGNIVECALSGRGHWVVAGRDALVVDGRVVPIVGDPAPEGARFYCELEGDHLRIGIGTPEGVFLGTLGFDGHRSIATPPEDVLVRPGYVVDWSFDLTDAVVGRPVLFDRDLPDLALGISAEGGSMDHVFVAPDRILFVARSRTALSSVVVDCSE